MTFVPVLHSVSYAGVWPGQARLSLDQFLDKAAELGYPGVMLMAKRPHLSALDYGPEACARLRERLERNGLQCSAIAGYTNFTADLEHGDIPLREIQIQHVTGLARMARDLGAGVVRVFTGYEHPAATYTAVWQMMVESLRECARRASEYGVTIGVQNHHDLAAHYESQRDLVQAVAEPNCKAIFDAWAPALHGTDILEAAREMAPLTCHTTAADYQQRPRFKYHSRIINYEAQAPWVQAVPIGKGFIDYAGFLQAMRRGGYRGPVAYEMCSPLLGGGSIENLDCYARRFLEFLAALGD
ncbi:MAG TPA: sugar phosphate isomerase/epimerase family protein [Bryobacterales bacterium]|nr:sugar phosphate isomerase/epimerase family protein [Bryobacterales bacterium]